MQYNLQDANFMEETSQRVPCTHNVHIRGNKKGNAAVLRNANKKAEWKEKRINTWPATG